MELSANFLLRLAVCCRTLLEACTDDGNPLFLCPFLPHLPPSEEGNISWAFCAPHEPGCLTVGVTGLWGRMCLGDWGVGSEGLAQFRMKSHRALHRLLSLYAPLQVKER